ncbi:MAG: SDR family NAD(P)-dependent oxidoreductase [Phycisphaerales bacterium]|jgi:acetoacetyl-CoA reductase/3-oxoacyl-[acyl-carrier protein] reductase|nr:SDR family NAD(P)-dependent oxidoreductase [Phycisphaerales bacterium]
MTPPRVIVTGGCNGIGLGIVSMLASDGYEVGVLDVQLDESQQVWGRAVDVSDSAQVNAAISEFAEDGLDALVNNAGIVRDNVSWKMSDDEWQQVIDVNLTGVFNCCRAAIPFMRTANKGSIVNIASINGLRGKFGQANYSAAKAGVIGLTKTLAKETAKFNVTVNAIAPGMIDTKILEGMSEAQRESAMSEILLGRIGTVEDVAGGVAFLCSERARFITGEVIKVDGGQYI